MKEFALIFRMDITSKESQPSPEQMAVYMEQWMNWINTIAESGQLADGGNHFSRHGKVLQPGNIVSDGPYISEKCSIAGYILILAKNMNDATKIAEKCPILNGQNTSVEIREPASPD